MQKLARLIKSKALLSFSLYIILLVSIFIINSLHDSYPDEFDNILGGKYILEGKLPHSGFFTHHGPVAYWVAALVEIFSGNSFVRFRIIYSLFLLTFIIISYLFLKKKFQNEINFYPFFLIIIAISNTYFWGHMLLADSLSAFLLIPAYSLLVFSTIYKKNLNQIDLIIINILAFLNLFSSLSYLYLIPIIYIYSLYLYLQKNVHQLNLNNLIRLFFLLGIPYLIYLGYLLTTNGLKDYIEQNIIFNAKYYIYNYPRPEGSGRINPIRFAFIIIDNFIHGFTGLLINAKDFNLAYPFNNTLAIGNAALIITLLLFGQIKLTIFIILVLIFANARSNPLTSKETDYQSAIYITLSILNLTFIIYYLYHLLNQRLELGKRIIFGCLLILTSLYGVFTILFLFLKFEEKVFAKYMGKAPLIYDRPQLAPILNKLVNGKEYAWIGPFEFEELFYIKAKIPSKFHILIPAMGKNPQIQKKVLEDFQKNRPKVIIFDRNFFILGQSPNMYAQFFLDFLDENYLTLAQYQDYKGNKYISVNPVTERIDIETKLYINKDNIDEIINKMLKENLIKPKNQHFITQ